MKFSKTLITGLVLMAGVMLSLKRKLKSLKNYRLKCSQKLKKDISKYMYSFR
jgi:hypothetical protein